MPDIQKPQESLAFSFIEELVDGKAKEQVELSLTSTSEYYSPELETKIQQLSLNPEAVIRFVESMNSDIDYMNKLAKEKPSHFPTSVGFHINKVLKDPNTARQVIQPLPSMDRVEMPKTDLDRINACIDKFKGGIENPVSFIGNLINGAKMGASTDRNSTLSIGTNKDPNFHVFFNTFPSIQAPVDLANNTIEALKDKQLSPDVQKELQRMETIRNEYITQINANLIMAFGSQGYDEKTLRKYFDEAQSLKKAGFVLP